MNTELNEKKCAHSLLYRIEEHLISGDLIDAKRRTVDLLNSLRELELIQEERVKRNVLVQDHRVLSDRSGGGVLLGHGNR
ncbi:hypothetical protein BTO30_02740 [Domibacillus antri]|uniref:Uncharacterized protein n=1 Tax=Domibacillus antri TaxID=1714264 RepID=A0A1Q8Q9D7_9BACI|nr:hypothetical protein [Domibacillus antri]OLN21622.1 hypothetical protein BTO30_14165 [Domibacillus antri]OLN23875.1 hypothetical protein BTO30_02740 [Domibacillus antri]